MYNWLTETYHAVTVSYIRKPRTVRIDRFHGWREEGRMRYGFSTVADAERFLSACGYARQRGYVEGYGGTTLRGRPATYKNTLWSWSNGTDKRAHLSEYTVVPLEKEMEAVKIQLQFNGGSCTVKELGSDNEINVCTNSIRIRTRAAVEQFLGKFYPKHELILGDKLDDDTYVLHLKKPAHRNDR